MNSRSLIVTGVVLVVAVHVALSGRYGYQRDELYFIACARHLAWGYVDQPPFIALVAKATIRLFGDSLTAIRLFPAIAAGLLAGLAAWLTARFGGGLFAQAITMLAVALAPFDLAVGNLLTMNAFEPLLWLALTIAVIQQIDRPRPWRWVLIGAITGIGTLNKWSMALYAVTLVAAIALTPLRRRMFCRGMLVALLVAGAIVAPNVAWQAKHGWAQLELVRNAAAQKNTDVGPLFFLLAQLGVMNPFAAPLWIAGLWALVKSSTYAGIALAFPLLAGVEMLLHGKVYYLAPIYPALIAAGSAAFERATQVRPTLRIGLASAIVVAGVAIMPEATPTLPLPAFLAYQRALDVRAVKMEKHPTGLVPQQMADQLGWNDLERTLAHAVDRLDPADRASAAILTADYGQAAALQFLGARDRLPTVISGHNQYYVWGPRGTHAVVVAVGLPYALLSQEYRSIVRVDTYVSPYVLPENSNLPVYVCRDPREPLERFWPRLRTYI